MFKLIRRISSSVFPRPDRPWSDDATSNAPTIGRKRRISSTEMNTDEYPSGSLSKKPRGGRQHVEADENGSATQESSSPAPLTEDVKEVTTGVKTIDLNHQSGSAVSSPTLKSPQITLPAALDPSKIPIPDDDSVDEEVDDDDAKKEALLDESPTDGNVAESAEAAEKDISSEVMSEGAETDNKVEVGSSKEDDPVNSDDLPPSVSEEKSTPDVTSLAEQDLNSTCTLPSVEPRQKEKEG